MALFKDLPFEVVVRIAETLCLHCTAPPLCACASRCNHTLRDYISFTGISIEEARVARIRALGALCLTSRHLRDAAVPHLYHCPYAQRWPFLVRTLLRRPDLARHVKTLHLPDRPGKTHALPPQVAHYFRTQVATYLATLPDEASRSDFLYGLADDARNILDGDSGRNGDDIDGGLGDRDGLEGVDEFSLVASLCPRVELVKAVDACGTGPLFIFGDGASPVSSVGGLPYLHTVELAHWDDEGGVSLSQLVPLFKAAPNLRVLRCYSLSDEGNGGELGVTMEKMREVELLNSAMSAEALRLLLGACPRLEVFKYQAGGALVGDEQFHPGEARDLVLEHGRRLKKVVLDSIDLWEEWWEEDTQEVVQLFRAKGVEFQITGT